MSEAVKWFVPNHQLTYFKLSEYEVSLFPVLSHNNNTDNITLSITLGVYRNVKLEPRLHQHIYTT